MELDCGKLVGMLSTDMSKSFDSLYSPLLIKKKKKKKMESYRFSDKTLDLVRSYFHNRQNRVKLPSMLSQWRVLSEKTMPTRILLWPFVMEYSPK